MLVLIQAPAFPRYILVNPEGVPAVWNQMQRQAVSSETITSVGYDRTARIVEVEFTGGEIFQFSPVPVYVYREFLDAPSKEVYVNTVLKPRYKSQGPLKP